jgi:two-component system, OmpR family, phosphate regulon sensor histidine kinase PhoR
MELQLETKRESIEIPADVLVVDDAESIRSILIMVLEEEGYNVTAVSDGNEAIEMVEQYGFDLAIVDVNLPGAGGIEVLRKIKQVNAETEVIIVSGYASLDTAVDAVRAGAYDYIIKPFAVQTIIEVVRRGLDKRRQAVEARQQMTHLEERNRELGLLYELRDAIGYKLDYNEVMELIMPSLHTELDYHASAFLLVTEEDQTELSIWTSPDSPREVVEQIELNLVSAYNSISDKPLMESMINTRLSKANFLIPLKHLLFQRLRSSINIPLVIKDGLTNRLAGMVNISSYNSEAFDLSTSKLFHSIANNIISDTLEKQRKMLAEEKNILETMVGSMSDGVIMFDRKKHISIINHSAKKMLGLIVNGVVRESSLMESLGNSRLAIAIRIICDRNGSNGYDKTCVEASFEEEIYIDSTKMFLGASVSSLKSDDGKTCGIIAVLRDITKRKEIDEAKSNFISTVSHELRTPLTSIKNAVSIIESSEAVDDTLQKFVGIANRNIDRLERLINEILAFSKLENGKMKMEFESVNLKSLIHETIANIQELATQKAIEINEIIPDNLPKAFADSERLEQVITNILDNAIKFTPENGRITITTRLVKDGNTVPNSDFLEVCISDTGIGIADEDQLRIFDRFERATLYNKGVGLGLAIVKRIIDSHNGKIWVESEYGKGSKFLFTVPYAKQITTHPSV